MKYKQKLVITVTASLALLAAGAEPARADKITVNFENIPTTYLYRAGNQNLGMYYPGLNFGPHVTGMDRVRYGYNDIDYPPHSGDGIIWGDYVDEPIRVDFLGFQSTFAEAWYTSTELVSLKAYDSANNLLASASGPGNYPGQISLISVSAPDIAYVTFYNHSMNCLVLDDFAYTPVPEPTTLSLLAAGGLALIWRRRWSQDGRSQHLRAPDHLA